MRKRSLGSTISRLKALAQRAVPASDGIASAPHARLSELTSFGSNPGRLKSWAFVPEGVTPVPLVVVLHGCTQTAAGYDRGAGWSELAQRAGFAVLFPEQQRENNANLCFNWFSPQDTARDAGEALSIRQMIVAIVERNAIDPKHIYVTGLSAGGAMTSVMLATYPELFAGGAIIAGLPYGAAASVPQAFERMRGHGHVDDAAYATLVRRASHHRGRWPTVSVWHGTADATVDVTNADAIIGQWRSLHGAGERPDRKGVVNGFPHRQWLDESGRVAIEDYRITGMGHGTPLKTAGPDGIGAAMPHMLDVGISSTMRIAEGWGLLKHVRPRAAPATRVLEPEHPKPGDDLLPGASVGVQATIEAALRSAGLMR